MVMDLPKGWKEVYKDHICTIVYIGEKTYIAFYSATVDNQISLTGSSTNYDFQIPFAFRIEYIILCADDATSKDIDIYPIPMIKSQIAYPARIFNASGDIETDKFIECGRQYKFPAHTVLRFKLNGTALKKIFVFACLQGLGK